MKVTPWVWNKSNGSASDKQTADAYNALTSKGYTSAFSHLVWNDLVDKVKAVCDALNREWVAYEENRTYERTKMGYSMAPLYSSMFNTLRFNTHYPRWRWAYDESFEGYIGRTDVKGVYADGNAAADLVYGAYFTELVSRLNFIISIINDSALCIELSQQINCHLSYTASAGKADSVSANAHPSSRVVYACELSTEKLPSEYTHYYISSPSADALLSYSVYGDIPKTEGKDEIGGTGVMTPRAARPVNTEFMLPYRFDASAEVMDSRYLEDSMEALTVITAEITERLVSGHMSRLKADAHDSGEVLAAFDLYPSGSHTLSSQDQVFIDEQLLTPPSSALTLAGREDVSVYGGIAKTVVRSLYYITESHYLSQSAAAELEKLATLNITVSHETGDKASLGTSNAILISEPLCADSITTDAVVDNNIVFGISASGMFSISSILSASKSRTTSLSLVSESYVSSNAQPEALVRLVNMTAQSDEEVAISADTGKIVYYPVAADDEIQLTSDAELIAIGNWEYPVISDTDAYITQIYNPESFGSFMFFDFERLKVQNADTVYPEANADKRHASVWEEPVQDGDDLLIRQSNLVIQTEYNKLEVY